MNRNKFIKLTAEIGEEILSMPSIVRSKSKYFADSVDPKIIRNQNVNTIHIFAGGKILKLPAKPINNSFSPSENKNENEAFKVLEGEIELTAGNKTTVLKAGDIAFGPKGVLHSCKIIGDKKARVILRELQGRNEEIFEELNELTEVQPDFKSLSAICVRYGISFVP